MHKLDEKALLPDVGEVYEDRNGRLLKVERVRVNDSLGREITGTIMRPNSPEVKPYSCDRTIWATVWYRPPQPPKEAKDDSRPST